MTDLQNFRSAFNSANIDYSEMQNDYYKYLIVFHSKFIKTTYRFTKAGELLSASNSKVLL